MSASVNCIRNDMLASAVSVQSMDEFARQEFNKKRKIIIRDIPPVSYADVKNFMGHFAVADISISKRHQQAVVTLKNGVEAERAVNELSHCLLVGVSVRVNLYRNDNLLCVSGLPRDVIVNNAQFRSLVETYGPVEKSFLMTSARGHPKGYGFVEFSHNREKSEHARSLMNGLLVGSSVLRCQFVNESLVDFSDLHLCCLLVSDVPSYLQTELYNAFCSIVSPVNFQSVMNDGQDFVCLIVEYETGVDAENACEAVQCKYSSIKIEYCVPGESTKCVYDRISAGKLERSMASPIINVCAAVVGLLNNNSSVVNYFKNLLLQLHENASSRKTNPGASDNYTDISLLSNPSFQVALLAVLAGHSPVNYNSQRNPCLSDIGEPMMVHAVEMMDKYSNEHTVSLWQSFISDTSQCELIQKASTHTVDLKKTVCAVPGSHPLNGFPCDSQIISRPQTSLITPFSNCGVSSSSAALIPASSALHIPFHSSVVFTAAPDVHVPSAILPLPSGSQQCNVSGTVTCTFNGAQTLLASCPLLPGDVYPQQASAVVPQHPSTGFVLPSTKCHFNQPAGASNSTMSLLSNSANSSAHLSASNFAIPPHQAISQQTGAVVSRPLYVNLPVSLNVTLPELSNGLLQQPFSNRVCKPCSTAVPPVLVSFNPVANGSVRSSEMVPGKPSSTIPRLFPCSSSQLPQASNFRMLQQSIELDGDNMHTAGSDHVDQSVLQKVVSAGGCMSRLKKQLGNGGMLKSTKKHDQRLRFNSTNMGGSVTKRKVLRPIFGRGVRDQLQRIVASQNFTSTETTTTTKSVEHLDIGCNGGTDPHTDQENRTVGRSEVGGVNETLVSSSHESPPITPVNSIKQAHFVPSPEQSPENGYIGQHSQGLGGHYADSYLAKRRKII